MTRAAPIVLLLICAVVGGAGTSRAGTGTWATVSPPCLAAGAALPVTVTGPNPCGFCIDGVHYGGNAQEVIGVLPPQFRHTDARPDTDTVSVNPVPLCTGTFTRQRPVVLANLPPPRIVRLLVSPSPADAGQPVLIAIDGTGSCAYTIAFGDGNSEPRSATLPDRLKHTYPAAGTYTVTAVAEAPCSGAARSSVVVRGSIVAGMSGLVVTPNPVAPNTRATLEINGSGSCRVTIDFGDDSTQSLSGLLPHRVAHVYSVSRHYTIKVRAEAPCRGEMRLELEVR